MTLNERRRSARFLVLGTALLVLLAIAPVAIGLAGAVVFYDLCKRPHARLASRVKPQLAAALIIATVLAFVALPLLSLGNRLATRSPAVLATLDSSRKAFARNMPAEVSARVEQVVMKARSAAEKWLPTLLETLGGSISWALLNWSVGLLGLYYLLLSGSSVWERMRALLPFSAAGAETLRVRLQDASLAIVAGTLLSAAVQGASIGLGFRLAGIRDGLFWALCGTLATLIPLVGNKLVWLPGLLYMAVTRNFTGATFIAIFGGLAPPLIDRVVRSNVSSRLGRVHPMITLVGALAGIRVAGVAGLILGPIALAMFFALADVYAEEYLGIYRSNGADAASDGEVGIQLQTGA